MSAKTINNKVACYPFEPGQITDISKKKLATVTGESKVVELFVCYETEITDGLYVGENDVIFVKTASVNSSWAKEKFTFQGVEGSVEFILVPVREIVLIDRNGAVCNEVCDECKAKEEVKKEPPKVN